MAAAHTGALIVVSTVECPAVVGCVVLMWVSTAENVSCVDECWTSMIPLGPVEVVVLACGFVSSTAGEVTVTVET